jgi:hypothetical protein
MPLRIALLCLLFGAHGCIFGAGAGVEDPEPDSGSMLDGSMSDTRLPPDATGHADAGGNNNGAVDTGNGGRDLGVSVDTGTGDTGPVDIGTTDPDMGSSELDLGSFDTGNPGDTGMGSFDLGIPDLPSSDTGGPGTKLDLAIPDFGTL